MKYSGNKAGTHVLEISSVRVEHPLRTHDMQFGTQGMTDSYFFCSFVVISRGAVIQIRSQRWYCTKSAIGGEVAESFCGPQAREHFVHYTLESFFFFFLLPASVTFLQEISKASAPV